MKRESRQELISYVLGGVSARHSGVFLRLWLFAVIVFAIWMRAGDAGAADASRDHSKLARSGPKGLLDEALQERVDQAQAGIIRLLKTDQRVQEGDDGTLVQLGTLIPWAKQQVDDANEDRLELFQRVWRDHKELTLKTIAKRYADKWRKEDRDLVFPPAKVELRIHGSDALSEKLIPTLVEGFLASRHYELVRCTREPSDPPEKEFEERGCPPSSKDFCAVAIRPNGETEAFNNLIEKRCDLVMSTIPPPEDVVEKLRKANAGDFHLPNFTCLVARDGISIVVSSSNHVPKMQIKTLEDIYSGRITNWKDVPDSGGRAGSIAVYYLDPRLSIHATFLSRISSNKAPVKLVGAAHACANSAELMQKLSADEGGIGYVSSADFGLSVPVREVPIASGPNGRPLLATRFTVRTDYPLQREFYLLARSDRSEMAREFVQYALKADGGQTVIHGAGFVDSAPLDDKERAKVRAELPQQLRTTFPSYRNFVAGLKREYSPFNIRFDFNSSAMRADLGINVASQLEMRQLVGSIGDGHTIVLTGHTDADGNSSSAGRAANARLALGRCETVAELLGQLGLKVEPINSANVFTADVPVGDDSTELGKTLNRRVEVWVR